MKITEKSENVVSWQSENVTDDVGELNEADILVYGQPCNVTDEPVIREDPEDVKELIESIVGDSESVEDPEIIYGSPEAVRYFQKTAIPPGGTDAAVIDVEDLTVRSKLVVRPLSSPDTYVDRHGTPGSRFRKSELVMNFEPESEPETHSDVVPECCLKSELEPLQPKHEEVPGSLLEEISAPEANEQIVEDETNENAELVPCETELVLDTEAVIETELEQEPETVSIRLTDDEPEEEVSELYTDEEDQENKAHAARVASVLNDLHRPRPDETPLDERAERMAEAILASAVFETVFLQPDNRSETTHSVPTQESSIYDDTDVPFIGSSFCRVRLPSTGTASAELKIAGSLI